MTNQLFCIVFVGNFLLLAAFLQQSNAPEVTVLCHLSNINVLESDKVQR